MENTPVKILQDPDPAKIDFNTLNDLIKIYPWFSLLHIIWLLKHRMERPADFDTELKKHIVYIHDRKRLYQIINSDIWPDILLNSRQDGESEENSAGDKDYSEEEKNLLEFSYIGEKEEEQEENDNNSQNNDSENNYHAESGFAEWVDKQDEKNNRGEHLIDKFLEADPGPIPADKKSELEGDVSWNSVEEDEDFITDTLAKIYIKQGLYSKAIFAYEKLSLKYPEKSVYFASQIEDIKNLLRNK